MSTSKSEAFWRHVSGDGIEACWVWTGCLSKDGYGKAMANGRGVMAYRHAYEVLRGPIPEGLSIDHLCRNRACVNPWHMEPVSHAENLRRSGPAQKTHCSKGHEYTIENTYLRPGNGEGRRDCRACIRERVRRYKANKSAALRREDEVST